VCVSIDVISFVSRTAKSVRVVVCTCVCVCACVY